MNQHVESVLLEFADDLVWPVDSMNVERAVLARLPETRRDRTEPRQLAYAVAALVLMSVVVYLVPPARQAVANLFGAAGIHITIGDPPFEQSVSDLGLGAEESLLGIDKTVGFEVMVPKAAAIGPPDGVFVGSGDEVNMAWMGSVEIPAAGGTGIGVLLTQRDAGLDGVEGVKTVSGSAQVEAVLVDGVQGFWIEGLVHTFVLVDDAGRELPETRRLAANVLLWTKDGINFRLETTGNLDSALTIADSLEPVKVGVPGAG